jgi:hypothetical protein
MREVSQAQQYILQLYNCHWMLVTLRHGSTHLPSHPQALLNLRLFAIKYYMIPLTVSTFGCISSVWFILADVSSLQAFEDGPDRGFRNVSQYKPDAGDTPKSGNS